MSGQNVGAEESASPVVPRKAELDKVSSAAALSAPSSPTPPPEGVADVHDRDVKTSGREKRRVV